MTKFVNPLDRLPQVPVDYANHILFGGLGGLLFAAALVLLSPGWYHTPAHAWTTAFLAVLVISAAKKIVDYFKEFETLGMCVAKTFITALIPAVVRVLIELRFV